MGEELLHAELSEAIIGAAMKDAWLPEHHRVAACPALELQVCQAPMEANRELNSDSSDL
jgi:hypothetical protein